MPSSLNRRQTCPITRRESEQLMDIFLHIPVSPTVKKTINDNINNNIQNDKDYSEEERPHLLQRSDSYKRATQMFSPEDDSDEVLTFKKENYDPQKYRSLPIDTKSRVRNNKGSPTSILVKRNKLNRQKSGTVPSSDSDNPISSSENRKKKSVFQRTKERIIFKLRKDKKRGEDINKKSKENKQEIQRTLNSHQYESASGVESRKGQRNGPPRNAEIVKPKVNTTKSSSPDSKLYYFDLNRVCDYRIVDRANLSYRMYHLWNTIKQNQSKKRFNIFVTCIYPVVVVNKLIISGSYSTVV